MKNLSLIVIILIFLMPYTLYGAIQKPIAAFEFESASYIKGEKVKTIDQSYCDENAKIVTHEWLINISGEKKKSSSLGTLIKQVSGGNIEVFYRVKDNKGNYSDWTSRKVQIIIPKPIKLKSFSLEKSTYAMGEKLQFKYTYDNPDELDIKSQRWRYKNLTTNGVTISGKPRYFNKQGEYEITLQLQDEQGNWTDTLKTKVKISNEKIERDGYYLFKKGKQGDLLEGYIDKDYNTFDEMENYDVTEKEGTLLVSNSPETLTRSGLLYQDKVKGEGRILLHHLNKTGYNKRLLILARNNESTNKDIYIKNEAISGPSRNILKTGQDALYKYFLGKKDKIYSLKPNEWVCIYSSAHTKTWKTGETLSGLLDFYVDGNVTLKIVALDENTPISDVEKLNALPRDMHIRGTFNVLERNYEIAITDLKNPTKLVIGKGEEEWLKGKDALTGEETYNKGNYGLNINLQIHTTEDMGIILNARGGKYLGALKWDQSKVFNVPNEDILSTQKVAALVGMVKKDITKQVTYMLPNGSAAPVLFGFVPEHLWK